MPIDIDERAQFVGQLQGDHVLPGGGKASDGAQVFVSIESRWSAETKIYGPMPSPVALFLNSSMHSYRTAIELRNSFSFDGEEASFTEISREFFDYIEAFFESVIFSATSIEAFCNVHIDDDEVYSVRRSKCTEEYRGEQIERWIPLDEKLTNIVAKKLNAEIDKSGNTWNNYKELIAMRDRLVHLKNKDRTNTSLDDETIWTFVATEKIINPPEVAISLMKLFFVSATTPQWLLSLEQELQ